MINIVLNGERQQISPQTHLAQLLKDLKVNPKQVAVAKNLEVVVRGQLAETFLKEGDQIEIFHAVGGG